LSPVPAQAGFFCPPGSTSASPNPCPAGSYCPSGSASGTLCPVAQYSLVGASVCLACDAGRCVKRCCSVPVVGCPTSACFPKRAPCCQWMRWWVRSAVRWAPLVAHEPGLACFPSHAVPGTAPCRACHPQPALGPAPRGSIAPLAPPTPPLCRARPGSTAPRARPCPLRAPAACTATPPTLARPSAVGSVQQGTTVRVRAANSSGVWHVLGGACSVVLRVAWPCAFSTNAYSAAPPCLTACLFPCACERQRCVYGAGLGPCVCLLCRNDDQPRAVWQCDRVLPCGLAVHGRGG
jgi:hypothetical protein